MLLSQPLVRSGFALAGSSGLTAVLGLAFWALAARRYPADEVGRASVAISTMMLLGAIGQLNFRAAMVRFLPASGRHDARRLVQTGYRWSTLASAGLAGVYVVVARSQGWMGGLLEDSWWVALWFVAAVAGWAWFAMQDGVLAGLRRAGWVPVENGAFSVIKIVLLLVLASVSLRYGLFASWTVAVAITLVPTNILIFRRLLNQIPADRPTSKFMSVRSYLAAEYLGSLFTLAAVNLAPLIVAERLGLAAAGLFYPVWVLGTSLDQLLANLTTSATVESSHSTQHLVRHTRSIAKIAAAVTAAAVAVLVVGAPQVLSIFAPSHQADGATLLRLVTLALIARVVIQVYLSIARVEGHRRSLVAVQAGACTLALGLGVLLIGAHGVNGVGIGYLVAQVVVALAVLPRVIKTLRTRVAPA